MENKIIVNLSKRYLCKEDLITPDPYDIWKTRIGLISKNLFYKNKFLGLVPAGLINLIDFYWNNKVRIGYNQQEYPIVRAQAALALMNIFHRTNKKEFLSFARNHIDWLLNNYCKEYHGYCWGLNFTWVYSANDIYNKNTPFSTHTPYALEALINYYNITKEQSLIAPIKSVLEFLEKDLKIMIENDTILALSYAAKKDRVVTNANSYIMYMYALLIPFFPNKRKYLVNKVTKIYNFIVSVQNDDGSWFYTPHDNNSFIDCFHSCFILKNIIKTNKIYSLISSDKIVKKAYTYLNNNFYNSKDGLYKRFAVSNKPSLVKYE